MIPGLLLEYLSEIGCGSWDQFRDALSTSRAATGQAPIWVIQNLAALGHVEIDQRTLAWAVCRPSLAEVVGSARPAAILCGARSPAFLIRAVTTAERLGCELVADWEGDVVEKMLFTTMRREVLVDLAAELGVPLVVEAARRLAQVLPTIGQLVADSPREPTPAGKSVERLLTTDESLSRSSWFDWRVSPLLDSPGIYRQQWLFSRQYWLRSTEGDRRVSKAVALYGHLHGLMRYHSTGQTVTFPADARPPDLHLRALVLCSGSLPTTGLERGRLQVTCVPHDVAARVMQRSGQKWS